MEKEVYVPIYIYLCTHIIYIYIKKLTFFLHKVLIAVVVVFCVGFFFFFLTCL